MQIVHFMHACLLSHVRLFGTPWTVARQAPLFMGFSRQEYWIGLLFPPPGDLADPGVEPASLALAGKFFIPEPPGKPAKTSSQQIEQQIQGLSLWNPSRMQSLLRAHVDPTGIPTAATGFHCSPLLTSPARPDFGQLSTQMQSRSS